METNARAWLAVIARDTFSRAVPLSVLLVEPDERERARLSAALRADGCQVVEVSGLSELEALTSGDALAARRAPDVVVSESVLGTRTAIQVLSELRRVKLRCPAVVLGASVEARGAGQPASGDVHLKRHPDLDELRTAVFTVARPKGQLAPSVQSIVGP